MNQTTLMRIEKELIESGLREKWDLQKKLQTMDIGELKYANVLDVNRRKVTIVFRVKENEAHTTVHMHEFKLPLPREIETIEKNLKLKEWKKEIESKIISPEKDINNYIKNSLLAWVTEKNTNEEFLKQFLKTLQVGLDKRKNLCFAYTELNGKFHKTLLSIKRYEQYSLEDLYTLANELSHKHWGKNYNGKIEIVGYRWSTTLAYFRSATNSITFSKHVNGYYSKEKVLDTLLHELVHWHLWSVKKPFKDIDETFIKECLRVGASLSMAQDAQVAYRTYCQKNKIEVDKKYAKNQQK